MTRGFCYTECPMDTLIHADIFFFISSIGFIILFIVLIIGAVHLVRLIRSLNDAIDTLKSKAKDIEADAEELIDEVRESVIFRLFFGRKRRSHSRTTEK